MNISSSYNIQVDYSKSLQEMIDEGKYDWKNGDITAEHFPMTDDGIMNLEVILLHLNRDISTENAEQEIARLGLKPAKIEHLLAFGAMYPEEQRKYPIVSLGSSWVDRDSNRFVTCLDEGSRKRRLDLYWTDDDWRGHCRFLGVRNRERISMKPHKYHAQKTVVDGITFHSKKEAKRYQELKLMEKGKVIKSLELQKPIVFFVSAKKMFTYLCDFLYWHIEDGRMVYEDVKGYKTPLYRLKKKIIEAEYEIKIEEI